MPPGTSVLTAAQEKAVLQRIDQRRVALQADNAFLRLRYEEVMRWANPPWDAQERRIDPRPERQSLERSGRSNIHIDLVGQAMDRWSALEVGAPPTIRVPPIYVSPPDPSETDPEAIVANRKLYDIDRAIAQSQATQMENVTREWMGEMNFHRTLLWAVWSKNAFGKAILRDGWDEVDDIPTCELLENPSQVYYGWTKRYGRRTLSWTMLVDEMPPEEANFRFGLDIPMDNYGFANLASWTGSVDTSELDIRPEQQANLNRNIYVEEYWELDRQAPAEQRVLAAFAVAGRIVEASYYPWRRLPFHVLEDAHVPTYLHGRSLAERLIGINEAYDDMLDRQQEVIEFESGPRYKGLNMGNSGTEASMPGPFEMLPLREGEDIAQIDTRVDFFPTQVHAEELRQAKYHSTGLTPIAWGMSPNAQTSGRALSAEWRAVELPLHNKLINMGPELREMVSNWWDYAESFKAEYRDIAEGYRRFEVIWEPLDIRDRTERTLDVIQRLQANIIDPELAMELTGIENVDEVMAKIRAYLLDPVYNPLRYQQYLILQQLEIQIRMQALQLAQMEQGQAPPERETGAASQLPGVVALAARGANAAAQQAQGPAGPVTEAANQPGATPGGLNVEPQLLSRTPLEGGSGNQVVVGGLGGETAPPTAGNQAT